MTSDTSQARLLVIDDDTKLCRLVKDYLETMGYEVALAHTGPEGLDRALNEEFHAILLDVMLPGLDGFEVLRRLRAASNVPVLMLTGRGDEADRIVGLEMGADDYLPKTFSTRELLARLRAVIRRSVATAAESPSAQITFGDLAIDPSTYIATLSGQALPLTRVEFDVLKSLASARGRVRSREQLLLEVADRDFDSFDRSIDVHIASLRKKLGDDPRAPRYIETVRGVGYVMRAEQ